LQPASDRLNGTEDVMRREIAEALFLDIATDRPADAISVICIGNAGEIFVPPAGYAFFFAPLISCLTDSSKEIGDTSGKYCQALRFLVSLRRLSSETNSVIKREAKEKEKGWRMGMSNKEMLSAMRSKGIGNLLSPMTLELTVSVYGKLNAVMPMSAMTLLSTSISFARGIPEQHLPLIFLSIHCGTSSVRLFCINFLSTSNSALPERPQNLP
jgi:hypothetical protein